MNNKKRQNTASKNSIKSFRNVLASGLSLALLFSTYAPLATQASAESVSPSVSINEVAWMGTSSNINGEWMELYNNTNEDISLDGWKLKAKDGTPAITLNGVIKANSYYLLERTSDDTVKSATANQIYTGALGNTGEALELYNANDVLVDTVSAWFAGDNTKKATMERVSPSASGQEASNWVSSDVAYEGGFGTPGAKNSKTVLEPVEPGEETEDDIVDETVDPIEPEEPYVYEYPTPQHINHVSEEDGAINIYFSKSAMAEYAYEGNEANYQVNLEERLIKRINEAQETIDIATYEINLPNLVNALKEKASEGVTVRMVADAKGASDPEHDKRYDEMRVHLERLSRGNDMVIGTDDDVHIVADSPIMAVEDPALRTKFGLPENANDIAPSTVKIGSKNQTGRVIVDGERKADGSYFSPDNQQHNKFVVADNKWVWTGSWNFTITGIYGSENNMKNNVLEGNQNHSVEMKSSELADIYRTEFNEMFGSSVDLPNPSNAKFHGRKTDNTAHQVYVGGRLVEVYFSPGDGALEKMTNLVKEEADHQAFFTIFSWSDQKLVDELKYKYEGSYEDRVGTRTGFEVKGLFDKGFTNQYWSANIDMQGRTVTGSKNNPNTRWNNPAPVFQDREVRKLHAKTMVIDADTNSDPTVVMGSTNWSTNGDAINDENMVFIHDKDIANQFVQEFYARYKQAGVNPELMHSELNLLERSKQAVEKAENTKDASDVEKAVTLVNGLNETNKPALAERLDVLQAEIAYSNDLTEAQRAVDSAELYVTQESVDRAFSFVSKLKDADQVGFTQRLNKLQEEIDYKNKLTDATNAVVKAEESSSQEDVDNAMIFVLELKLEDQNPLVDRLVVVQQEIIYNGKLQVATDSVLKAEQSKSAEDVYSATLLFTDLNESDIQSLTSRLDKIVVTTGVNSQKDLKHAEKEVFLAEKVGNDTHKRKAQERVTALFHSAEKTALQKRLDALK